MRLIVTPSNEFQFVTPAGVVPMQQVPGLLAKVKGKTASRLAIEAGLDPVTIGNIKRGSSKAIRPLLILLLAHGYEILITKEVKR